MNGEMPASLSDAIALQPTWLLIWVGILAATNLAAVLFLFRRKEGSWTWRPEAWAILVAFLAAGAFMEYLYGQYGYVRLLGLAHLVFWTPVYLWIFARRKELMASAGLFGKYIMIYLIVDGISLVIDLVDVIRYMTGTD